MNEQDVVSKTLGIRGGQAYKEMNLMLIITFLEGFETVAFKEKFKIGDFDLVKPISCISKSTLPQA